MHRRRVIVVSASSDIGAHFARHFVQMGADVVGTYRTASPLVDELRAVGVRLFPVDITSPAEVSTFTDSLREIGFAWNVLISCAGTLEPIGKFFELDFHAWESGFATNSIAQLRVLHAVHRIRDTAVPSKIVFFAGGGTNGPFDNYSAYCAGKLVLMKMTELLDSEYPDLQTTIIGTGWVNTKIHNQTLSAGDAAGKNLDRTREFLRSGNSGSSLDTVTECVEWCMSAPRAAVGGRNFSLVHDPWRSTTFLDELIADPNRHKLRRS
jgi:NAD(P)-dependent dehydrogenase (short-subunit alcohol dehydrogenase family)